MMALYSGSQLDKAGQRRAYLGQRGYLSTEEQLAEDMPAFDSPPDCIINLWHGSKSKVIAFTQNTCKQAASLVCISNFLKA